MNADPGDFDLPDTFQLKSAKRPNVDNKTFRDAMASLASTVCVVTTQLGDERLGRTVTAMFSLSADPPTILISIDMESRLADHIAKTNGFSLAMLSERQADIANAFAGRVDPEKRFENGLWSSWMSGHPRLAGAVAALDCEVIGAIEIGTHVLFAGALVDIELVSERPPLIWHQREYNTLAQSASQTAEMAAMISRKKSGTVS